MPAGDRNPVPGGSGTPEDIAAFENTYGDREQGVGDCFSGGTPPAQKTVATAGSPEQLTASATPCKAVVLVGLPLNTGRVAVGLDNTTRAADATFKSLTPPIYAETAVVVHCRDASLLWLDTTVNGEGVSWTVLTP